MFIFPFPLDGYTAQSSTVVMVTEPVVNIEKWKKKRDMSFVSYLLQSLLDGLQTSIIGASLWIYVATETPANNRKAMFGLIGAVFNLNPMLFGIGVSRWTDRTRKSKQCILLCTGLSAIGSVLFMLPFSPYLLIIGRFMNGFIPTTRPVMFAEISRSYSCEQLQTKLPLMGAMCNFGYAIGPLLAMMFTKVDVWIGKLHLGYGNANGLLLLVLTVIQMIILSIFTHNISDEYDLKAEEQSKSRSLQDHNSARSYSPSINEDEPLLQKEDGRESVFTILHKLVSNHDTLLLLVMTFVA